MPRKELMLAKGASGRTISVRVPTNRNGGPGPSARVLFEAALGEPVEDVVCLETALRVSDASRRSVWKALTGG
jgi:hypothetical protein